MDLEVVSPQPAPPFHLPSAFFGLPVSGLLPELWPDLDVDPAPSPGPDDETIELRISSL